MSSLVKIVMSGLQGKKEVVVGSKVSQGEFDALSEVCEIEDRSMSYVLSNLAIRGLALYKQDGLLKITPEEERLIEGAANRLRPQQVTEATGELAGAKERGKKKDVA